MPTRTRWLLAAVVALALVGVLGYVVYRHHQPPDARALGVPVVVGNRVYLTDGTVVDLAADAGSRVSQVVVVPGGIAYSTFARSGPPGLDRIWFRTASDGGSERLGIAGDLPFTVSRDGRTLVAVGLRHDDSAAIPTGTDFARVTAFDLTTGAMEGTTEFAGATVVGADGDWVILQRFDGGHPNPSELWNVRTGRVTPFAAARGVHPMAVTATGAVFRRVDVPESLNACYDLVTPGATVPTGLTGYCGDQDILSGDLSPDGRHLFAVTQEHVYIVDVDALRQSRWSAVTLLPDVGPTEDSRWASNDSIINRYDSRFEICTLAGKCTAHDIPDGGYAASSLPPAST